MKIMSLRLALQAAVLVIVFSRRAARKTEALPAFRSQNFRPSWNIAKPATGCRDRGIVDIFPCHGSRDSSPKYLENQLRAFFERKRLNPVMSNVAHVLSSVDGHGLGRAF